jgi:hypothetical protein
VKAREEEVAVRIAVRESFEPDDPLHSSIVKDDESLSFSLPWGCIEVATQVNTDEDELERSQII